MVKVICQFQLRIIEQPDLRLRYITIRCFDDKEEGKRGRDHSIYIAIKRGRGRLRYNGIKVEYNCASTCVKSI